MKALSMSAAFPCSRAVKMANALKNHRIRHDAWCSSPPPHMGYAFDEVFARPMASDEEIVAFVADSDAELIHVHGDLAGYWLAPLVREATDKPIILNVHDLPSDREVISDLHERAAFEVADGLVWVTERQRDFAAHAGLPIDKPSCCIGNFSSSDHFVEKPLLPHIGGLVYEGGVEPRGHVGGWRDLSAVADTVPLHIYAGNSGVDYGISHGTEFNLHVLHQRLASHDWGFLGVHPANEAWNNSLPNKLFEYMAAGIPFIALNVPLAEPFAEEGLGICVYSLRDLQRAVRTDPKPYRKRVLANRRRYTMEANIDPLADLYRELGGAR